MTDPTIPSDMTMLLRLIDSKFETSNAKLDGLKQAIEGMTTLHKRFDERIDDHEGRLQTIEQTMESRKVMLVEYADLKLTVKANAENIDRLQEWQTRETTTATNAKAWGGAVWGLIGSAVTGIVGWIIVSYARAHGG